MPTFSLRLTQTPQNQQKAISSPSTNTRSKAKQTLEFAGKSEQAQDNNNHDDEVACDQKDERTKSKLP